MKTVKFKDLPNKVQQFCNRIGYAWIGNIVDTEWLHIKADWSKATDEERLVYAEWKYPKGTKFKPAHVPSTKYFCESTGNYEVNANYIYDPKCESDRFIIHHFWADNRWAEIIEEKEEESKVTIDAEPLKINLSHLEELDEERREEFKKILAEPTFKAGDEVYPNFYERLPENMFITGDKYFYVGKCKNGKICVEDNSGEIWQCFGIRKPDPDKHLRETAKFIMDRYIERDNKRIEQMLIEALKKGKEL